MRIGFDFDNTIIDYNYLFHKLAVEFGWLPSAPSLSKKAVKQFLLHADGNDLRWQKLQAIAYGERILKANAFHGALELLSSLLSQKHQIFIVSHKTKYSNFDAKYNLQDSALQWIKKNLPDFPPKNIFFETTREAKIERIKKLDLDIFIDDLAEVFEHEAFPHSKSIAVLFDPEDDATSNFCKISAWRDIYTFLSLIEALRSLKLGAPSSFQALKGTRNNRLFEVKLKSGENFILKQYFTSTGAARASNEYQASQLLWNAGIHSIPQPIFIDSSATMALYTKIPGTRLSDKEIGPQHIEQAGDFIVRLFQLAREQQSSPNRGGVGKAYAARLALGDYLEGINNRLSEIQASLTDCPHGEDVDDFLQKEFLPLQKKIFARFHEDVRQAGLSLQEIQEEQLILSPSDFGFHNMLVDSNDTVHFLDLEYFGWDDPAKVLADFFHSLGQSISWELKWHFLDHVCSKLPCGAAIRKRWKIIVDVIALEWILIALNVVVREIRERKIFADPTLTENELVKLRLLEAKRLTSRIKSLSGGGKFVTVPMPNLSEES